VVTSVLVAYDSKTGNTQTMAKAIGEGIKESGLKAEVKRVEDTSLDDLVDADGIVLGSPTHFCSMSEKMKSLIDKSIEIYPEKLRNKVGAVFTPRELRQAETRLPYSRSSKPCLCIG